MNDNTDPDKKPETRPDPEIEPTAPPEINPDRSPEIQPDSALRLRPIKHLKLCRAQPRRLLPVRRPNSNLVVTMMKTADKTRICDSMTHNVVTVRKDASLIKAIKLMDNHGLTALPVVDQDNCVCGMLSMSDLISLIYEHQADMSALPFVSKPVRETLIKALAEDNDSVKVASAMVHDIDTVSENDHLADAARLLLKNSCHHLPVVDETRKPIGIISTSDIVRRFASQPLN